MGVVNQAFPADSGAWFFKIDAHHDQQLFFVLLFQRQQFLRVFEGGSGIMDGAGADDDEQAFVAVVQDVGNRFAGGNHQLGGGFADGQIVQVGNGGQELGQGVDADVVGQVVLAHGRWFG